MSGKFRWLLFGVCGLALLGCSDTLAPPLAAGPTPGRDLDVFVPLTHSPAPGTRIPAAARGGLSPSKPRLDESGGTAWIRNVSLFTSFDDHNGFALADADYYGTHWSQSSTMRLRLGTTEFMPITDAKSNGGVTPVTGHLTTLAMAGINRDCGYVANGSASYAAAIKWDGTAGPIDVNFKPSSVTTSKTRAAVQPICGVDSPPSGGGGDSSGGGAIGGGGDVTCYFYYEYYTDTGEIIYMEFLGCT